MMTYVSGHRLVTAVLVSGAVYLVMGGALAASKHTQTAEGLDHLIPQEKWAGAGLNKLTLAEQQTLAEDITSLLAGARRTENGTAAGKDRNQWRKLQLRMTKDGVRKILGEPETVSVSRFAESWYYIGGTVTFDGKGRVEMWSEN
jgi:hypothetical protein